MHKALAALLGLLLSALPFQLTSAEGWDALEYRNVGPLRGGRVTAVAGTVREPGTFYLGASGGGVWKTTDYGESWSNVSDGYFKTPSIGDIAVSQNDPNILYVGTGTDGLRSNIIAGKGVYKSVNGGDSWEHVGLDNTGHIGAVEIDPRSNNTVWVAAIGQAFNPNPERGVYKTTDGGQNWERVLYKSAAVGFSDVELLPGNPDVVFATAWRAERKPWTIVSGGKNEDGGLYKSVDGGANWRRITEGLPEGLIGKMDLAISPADSSVVYLLVEAPGDEGGLYRSTDQGESFEQVSSENGIRTRPFYYTNVDVDPTNADVVYVMATRYFKSVDGGKSWSKIDSPHGDNHDMWINPENPELFIQANDGGANVTHNGGKTWSTQFNQPTAELYQVEVDDQYPYWLYAGQQDNWTTIAVPSRAPWGAQHPQAWLIQTGGCETGPAVPKPGNHNIVYANCKGRFTVFDKRTGTERGYYVGAADMYGHNPADLRYRFQRVSPVHVSPHDPDVVYHGSQYVHRTTDDGLSWDTISPDLTAFEADKQVISGSPITRDITGEEFYSTLYSLRESPVQRGVIWTGANDGPVHVTRDGGENWDEVTPRGLPKGGRVDSVEPSPHDAASAYISVLRYQLGDWKPYVYKTENYGKRWRLLTDGRNGIPADHPVRVVREDPERPGLLYAGTEYGLYISFDDGESWQSFQQNLPVTPVTDIKLHRGDLVLSTMGRGFWVLDSLATLRQAPWPETPNSLTLFEPAQTIRYRQSFRSRDEDAVPQYPTPSAIIDYYLPEDAGDSVRLEVLDSEGNLVNAFRSKTVAKAKTEVVEDMAMNRMRFIEEDTLTAQAGLNRFHWDMTWRGAWRAPDADDKDASDRYDDGPLAGPGVYTLRLSVGDTRSETPLTLVMDPRVADTGVTEAMVIEQVALERRIVELLDAARRLAAALEKEREGLDAANPRADVIDKALAKLVTAEGTYQLPTLIDQLDYLYDMLKEADQAPGRDAVERMEVLARQFQEVQAAL
ncbi:MAG: hypothetical protein V2I66_11255 [Halieaceae bacterium]|jgi:photosystem II stability/assembly factor-like uncharacterized protein|nr:hypothetical protein [Halieaceae bacterium]